MNSSPFTPTQLRPPSLVQRLLGRKPARNALVELVNALAEDPLVEMVSQGTVEEIQNRYGVDIASRFPREVEGLYRQYLLHCLDDRRLATTELEAADRLANVLGLPTERRTIIQRQVARKVYLNLVDEVLEDGVVDPEERAFLADLETHLGLPADMAEYMLELRKKQLEKRRRRA